MTKFRNLNYGDAAPEMFFDAIMELLGSYVSGNFIVSQVDATTLRVAASTDNAQVGIAINGRWRYNAANADAIDPGGVAGTHTLWVTASDNAFGGGPPEVDSTVYAFGLQLRASGSPATALSRQIGTVVWNGTAITRVDLSIHDVTQDPIPVGSLQLFAGAVPTGWQLCDGTAISRTSFPRLFAAIGTTWGVGNGSTTFNVPDLRGRVPVGSGTGSGLTARTLAATGGVETYALSIAELAAHDHGGATGAATPTGTISSVSVTGTTDGTLSSGSINSVGDHTHSQGTLEADPFSLVTAVGGSTNNGGRLSIANTGGGGTVVSNYSDPTQLDINGNTGAAGAHGHTFTGASHTHTFTSAVHAHTFTGNSQSHTISSQGSGTAHQNMQPFAVVNYIIRAA